MLWILFGNLAYLYIVWKLTLYQLPAIWVIFWGRSYGGQCVRVRPYPYTLRCLFPIPYCLPCPTLPRHSCHAPMHMPHTYVLPAMSTWSWPYPPINLFVTYITLCLISLNKSLHLWIRCAYIITTKEQALTQREWEQCAKQSRQSTTGRPIQEALGSQLHPPAVPVYTCPMRMNYL